MSYSFVHLTLIMIFQETLPQMLNKLVMIKLYINLHSSENQQNYELNPLKDFDTIGDNFGNFSS